MPGSVNFYLKQPERKGEKQLIYLKYKYSGQVFVYAFGEKIYKKNWNANKQRVKSNTQTAADGQHSLNDLLDNLESLLESTYRKELKNGIPAKSVLKASLDNFRYQNLETTQKETFISLLKKFASGEITKEGGEMKSRHTTKVYNTVRVHLENFIKEKKYPVDFGTINLTFYRQYTAHLSELGLGPNTKAKHIQIIKTVMNEALEQRLTNNTEHRSKKFKVAWKETDAVYLTEADLQKLYSHDFSCNKRLEQVRDLFIFGCRVGLRFSDYSSVRPENIVPYEDDYRIHMVTGKTKEPVIIPCYPEVLEIFEKYKHNPNKLPRTISNQKFNEGIKLACKEAKLNDMGRLVSDPGKELWECVSSHAARRSFASNLYLEGFPAIDLMKITGHKTERAFLKYIRVTRLNAADRLTEHIKKTRTNSKLKAV